LASRLRYKTEIDHNGTPQFGLIAEDVEKVNPDLVVRDKERKPYTVRYDAVNAMLLNEFLKAHRKIEEQQAMIERLRSNAENQQTTMSELKRDMGTLTAQLNEQASQIQKVSAQVQTSKVAPQIVASP
jgi:septal ring factor EnvC (AmiA/AmiB activator)